MSRRPASLSSFIGREAELDTLAPLLRQARLMLVATVRGRFAPTPPPSPQAGRGA